MLIVAGTAKIGYMEKAIDIYSRRGAGNAEATYIF